jgi:NAD(P)H-flavin reductase/hemoglobin-like flavoprotein
VESAAGKATAYFYGRLFASNPEMRALFPLAMDRQRDRFFRALASLVWSVDCPEQLAAYVAELGRDHRRFGVTARHYPEFVAALLATVREFAGPAWSDEVAAAWVALLDLVTRTMLEAADAEAKQAPSWWLAEVTEHQRRGDDLAVLTVRPDQPLGYQPGQYIGVQSARWPREWRDYSIANAPREDGTLSLHVRAVPGGLVSTALVQHTVPGDTLLLGPAKGTMTLPPEPARGLLCVAGGTGLAPIKAIVEQAALGWPERNPTVLSGPERNPTAGVTLLYGARTAAGLYDLRDLMRLAASWPALELITAVSDEPGSLYTEAGVADLLRDRNEWNDREVYVCGPPGMVSRTQAVLAELGVPAQRVHYDEPDPPAALDAGEPSR